MRAATLTLVTTLLACGGNRLTQTPQVPQDRLVGCFVAQLSIMEVLAEFRRKPGDTAHVRIGWGPIPGWGGGSPDQVQIVFYAADGRHAWINFATVGSGGRIEIWPNAYTLVRGSDGRWSASEGHGGIGTYVAIGRYVDGLESRPLQTVKLEAKGGPTCTIMKIP